MKNNLPRIYLDMDGVLVDFEKQLVDTVKMPISQWMKLDRKKRWDPVIARKDFWSTAPWNNEGKKLLQFVKKYKAFQKNLQNCINLQNILANNN